MNKLLLIAVILPSFLFGRTWTDLQGRKVEGELLTYNENQITIKRLSDGKTFTINRSVLSNADNKLIDEKIEESKPKLTEKPDGAPSFRGVFPGMTFDDLIAVTKKEPLEFKYTPDEEDRDKGFLWLQPDYDQIKDNPKYENYWSVAVSKDGTKYEWEDIAVEMYDGRAVEVSFGTPSRNASFLNSITIPWASMMLDLLTEKHGEPDVMNKHPSEFSVLDLSSGFKLIVAKWIKEDYEIQLGIGEYQSRFYADIAYTFIPLHKKQESDKSSVQSNF